MYGLPQVLFTARGQLEKDFALRPGLDAAAELPSWLQQPGDSHIEPPAAGPVPRKNPLSPLLIVTRISSYGGVCSL